MGQLRRITGLPTVLRLPPLHQLRRASVWLSIDGSAYIVDSFVRRAERKNPGLTMVMWIANRATSDASDSILVRLRALYQPVTPLRPGSDSSGVNVVSRDMDDRAAQPGSPMNALRFRASHRHRDRPVCRLRPAPTQLAFLRHLLRLRPF